MYVLENAKGLTTLDGGKYLEAILAELHSVGQGAYNVYHDVVNTKDHGIPQNRERWYCVGILKSIDDGSFVFPKTIPSPPVSHFLDPVGGDKRIPPKTHVLARHNVRKAMSDIVKNGGDPHTKSIHNRLRCVRKAMQMVR